MEIKTFTFNLFREHTMVAWTSGPGCVIVDPGWYNAAERAEFFSFLEDSSLKPEAILLTHGHLDHVYGVAEARNAFDIPVYMDPAEVKVLEFSASSSVKLGLTPPDIHFDFIPVTDGMRVRAAGMEFVAISTPGHSPGGLCWLEEKERVMFSGDTLFADTIGRTDMMYSEYDDEIRSIMEKIIILDPDIAICPGHGPSSTIGHERTHNPFLEPFNEPEPDPDEEVDPVEIHA